jgi:hypothetical protein
MIDAVEYFGQAQGRLAFKLSSHSLLLSMEIGLELWLLEAQVILGRPHGHACQSFLDEGPHLKSKFSQRVQTTCTHGRKVNPVCGR